jgi:hypothetical protein
MDWAPTGEELLADYDTRDLNGVDPTAGAGNAVVDLDALANAYLAPNLGALARAVEGSGSSNENHGEMNANAVAARNAQRTAAQAARQAAEEASEEWRRKKGGSRTKRNRRNKKRKTTRRNRSRSRT